MKTPVAWAREIAGFGSDYYIAMVGQIQADAQADLRDDLARLRSEVERFRSILPRCLGTWTSGSGGHRVYAGDCREPGKWDVGLGYVCDQHRTACDDDAWDAGEEVVKLRAEVERLREEVSAVNLGAFDLRRENDRLRRLGGSDRQTQHCLDEFQQLSADGVVASLKLERDLAAARERVGELERALNRAERRLTHYAHVCNVRDDAILAEIGAVLALRTPVPAPAQAAKPARRKCATCRHYSEPCSCETPCKVGGTCAAVTVPRHAVPYSSCGDWQAKMPAPVRERGALDRDRTPEEQADFEAECEKVREEIRRAASWKDWTCSTCVKGPRPCLQFSDDPDDDDPTGMTCGCGEWRSRDEEKKS